MRSFLLMGAGLLAAPAFAGPPYVTDDPEPTDKGRYEIYTFASGVKTQQGAEGAGGIDFNYGGAKNLQLTAVLPLAWSDPRAGSSSASLGNIELAAKYKFLHQEDIGWDIAFFPRVFLPAGSDKVGERHASLLLPVWIGRSGEKWATFGGGGCVINHGGGSQNFCEVGWAATRQVLANLQLGAEIYHQSADEKGGKASSGLGVGAIYDLNERYHLLASFGPRIQNAAETNRYSWYIALETTF